MKRAVVNVVPHVEDNLLVAIARCGDNPAIINAGRDINPPPPAIESISPARNRQGQTIKNMMGVTFILCPPISPRESIA